MAGDYNLSVAKRRTFSSRITLLIYFVNLPTRGEPMTFQKDRLVVTTLTRLTNNTATGAVRRIEKYYGIQSGKTYSSRVESVMNIYSEGLSQYATLERQMIHTAFSSCAEPKA